MTQETTTRPIVLNFRVSPVELAQLRQAAQAQGSTVSELIRAGLATAGVNTPQHKSPGG